LFALYTKAALARVLFALYPKAALARVRVLFALYPKAALARGWLGKIGCGLGRGSGWSGRSCDGPHLRSEMLTPASKLAGDPEMGDRYARRLFLLLL
jgi:hypothetical protein